MNDKRTVLITRIRSINKEKDISDFRRWCDVFLRNRNIIKAYILSDQLSKDSLKLNHRKIEFIILPDSTSPVSLNFAIERLTPDTDYFLVSSREVAMEDSDIERLLSTIKSDGNLLVVGFKFTIKVNQKLNEELKNYYKDKTLIAYRVPWNTCAIWNYRHFHKYVGKFDEICSDNDFRPVCVCIDNVCSETEHKGMEDGLAIAKAISNKKLYFKLIARPPLSWVVNDEQRHREKLARKNTVLRDFMAWKGYSEKDLLGAEK